jgi:hypothetical protein
MYMIQENVVGVPFFVFWCPLVYDGMMLVGSLKPVSRGRAETKMSTHSGFSECIRNGM